MQTTVEQTTLFATCQLLNIQAKEQRENKANGTICILGRNHLFREINKEAQENLRNDPEFTKTNIFRVCSLVNSSCNIKK